MAGRFPQLWVLLVAAFLVTLMGPVGAHVPRRLEVVVFDRWISTFHDLEAAPWPADLVTIPVNQRTFGEVRGDGSTLLRREDLARLWDRLHALGARVIVQDGQLSTRRGPEVDEPIAEALARNRVLLPVTANAGGAVRDEDSLQLALLTAPGARLPPIARDILQTPLPEFAKAAKLGHVILFADPLDGRVRRFQPALRVEPHGEVLPSLGLVALAIARGADLRTLRVEGDRLLVDGLAPIPFDPNGFVMELVPETPENRVPRVEARDVLDPTKEASVRLQLEGKIALVYTAIGTADSKPTALGVETYGGLVQAHGIRLMAAGHAPRFPPGGVVLVPLLVLALLGAGAISRREPRTIAALAFSAPLLWAAVQVGVYRGSDVFLPFVLPVLFLAGSGIALFLTKSFSVVRRMETAEARADAGMAPRGEIALVFTDVQGSTLLWDRIPAAMRVALDLHNALLRKRLEVWRGYEVKTEGDAFMLAFADPADALAWCLDVQTRLLAEEWPEALLALPDGAQEEGAAGALLWRGLRVRMGIHTGSPEPRPDPKTGRMDYFGPVVNKAARVAAMAHGGQVLFSGSAWERLAAAAVALNASTKSLGTFALKGISAPEPLHEIAGENLAERRFPPPARAPNTGEHPVRPPSP